MPNWTQTVVTLGGMKPSLIDKIEKFSTIGHSDQKWEEEGGLFALITGKHHSGDGWYDFNLDHYGTKWDVHDVQINREHDDTVVLMFQTAWSPPLKVFEHLEAEGVDVDAVYLDEGCNYAGQYFDGEVDEYDYKDLIAEDSIIPGPIWDAFEGDILDARQWAKEQEEEENDAMAHGYGGS